MSVEAMNCYQAAYTGDSQLTSLTCVVLAGSTNSTVGSFPSNITLSPNASRGSFYEEDRLISRRDEGTLRKDYLRLLCLLALKYALQDAGAFRFY